MNKDELIILVDRSGSMSGYERATINGVNDLVKTQKELDDNCNVTIILFDDKYEVLCTSSLINDCPRLNDQVYYVRGGTALIDAMEKAIDDAGKRFSEQTYKPNKVIVQIFSDGYENASKTPREVLNKKITHQQEKYGWDFIYVGCDHNVKEFASTLGFMPKHTFEINKQDIYRSYSNDTSMLISSLRAG